MKFVYSVYHWLWALASALRYGFPSHKLKVIGVTGTKGKSTTLAVLVDILEKAGYTVALLSSVSVKVADHVTKNVTGNTMPGRFFIQKFLYDSVRAGCDYALIEVTSQGVVQHRHRFINWHSAGFLDIHPEHIESHGSFENYLDAKVDFFRYVARTSYAPRFFINDRDEHAQPFVEAAGSHPLFLFSAVDIDDDQMPPTLPGEFNKINVAAAVAFARAEEVPSGEIEDALRSFSGVAGRMERVIERPFEVYVDYAHTPDSLEQVYAFLKARSRGRLLCVLGSAGGGRDTWKRPRFGQLAGQYCDEIILTNEDPFEEDPRAIIGAIHEGISASFSRDRIFIVDDRRAAISLALEHARELDTIVITGKGSEEYIRVKGGKRIPWSDVRVVQEEFANMKK